MMNRYSTRYRNHAHQVFVTPSKHLHALKDGRIKYQTKPIETKLDGIENLERNHIVHFIVADHFSSAFYAESHPSKLLPDFVDFLRRAWRKKTNHFFEGLPELVLVPDAVRYKFPDAIKFMHKLELQVLAPTSGFQAGIHQVRNWEKELKFATTLFEDSVNLSELSHTSSKALVWAHEGLLNRAGIKLTRKQIWDLEIAEKPTIKNLEF
jgi:hypothetical protein